MERLSDGFGLFMTGGSTIVKQIIPVSPFERQGDAIGLAVSHGVNLKAAVRQFGKVNPVILPGLRLPTGLLN